MAHRAAVDGLQTDPERVRAFWRNQLAGLPAQIVLPFDRPRSPALGDVPAGQVHFSVPEPLHRRLRGVADAHEATPSAVLQSALAAVLSRMGAGPVVPLGWPVPGRELSDPLIIRVDLAGNPAFSALVRQVAARQRAAIEHRGVVFAEIGDGTVPRAPAPAFQVLLHVDTAAASSAALGKLRLDLDLRFTERPGEAGAPAGLEATISFARDAFDPRTIADLAERLTRVLAQADADPALDQLDLMLPGERHRLVSAFNDTARAAPETTLPELFEEQARTNPDSLAVLSEDVQITYQELNRRANRLARRLVRAGVAPETIVAIALPRSLEQVTSMLAVLKAGGAYLPIDPAYPAERVAYMCADAQPICVLTSIRANTAPWGPVPVLAVDDAGFTTELSRLPATDLTDAERRTPLVRDHPAYVIYTSGSTGRPKGTVVPHSGVPNLAADYAHRLEITRVSRLLQFASPAFDASVADYWPTWAAGAALVLAPADRLVPGAPLAELIAETGVTHVTLPPAVLPQLEAEGGLPEGITLLVAGEACPAAAVSQWASGRRMINAYGPTETTVAALVSTPLEPDGATPPIGRPISNVQAYVLDTALRPVPRGVTGELYIAGAGLARGYLGRPGLTAERFVLNPFGPSGTRMYRTGDLARHRADGAVEFVGRVDDQIKLRGFRIEPGEIVAALCRRDDVAHATVLLQESTPGDARLVAHVGAAPGAAPDPGELRRHLGRTLPDYMLPARVMVHERLPLTPNGKVDRDALPLMEATPTPASGSAPRTPQERLLCELFAELLGLPEVRTEDDFFAIGGHSLLATQLVTRIRKTFGVRLAVRSFFEDPTVAGVARRLAGAPTP